MEGEGGRRRREERGRRNEGMRQGWMEGGHNDDRETHMTLINRTSAVKCVQRDHSKACDIVKHLI